MTADEIKRTVAHHAVDTFVESGMKVGLGTGSTAIHAVRRVAEHVLAGRLTDLICVSTSFDTTIEAQRLGLTIRELNDGLVGGHLDLSIDGADEVERGTHHLIKGGGGALTLEKITEYASDRFVVVVDGSKLVDSLGTAFRIPLEVIPAARASVTHACEALGADVALRTGTGKMGPVVTDHGNILLDLLFTEAVDAHRIEAEFNLIPGVVENGLFARCNRPTVIVGQSDGRVEQIE